MPKVEKLSQSKPSTYTMLNRLRLLGIEANAVVDPGEIIVVGGCIQEKRKEIVSTMKNPLF